MIAVIDYEMGNLRSVQKALESFGGDASIVTSPDAVAKADKLVLPGVGAIKPTMDRLNELGWPEAIKAFVKTGKPFLGICVGFQALFDRSTEGGDIAALGLLGGTVERFPGTVKAPQMGWNKVEVVQKGGPMFQGIEDGSYVYFCHSYYAKPADPTVVAAITRYGVTYASAVCKDNIWGVQFHPEKSQDVGLGLLRNFVTL